MKTKMMTLIALFAGAAMAQTDDALTWERCLDYTWGHSPDLLSVRSVLREEKYSVISAHSAFLPQLAASASLSYGESESGNAWNSSKSSSAGVSLSQDLYTAGSNQATLRRAAAQLQVVKEQYRQALSDVELKLRVAFIDVLYAQDLMALTEKIAERRADNVRLIQLRFDGGRENAGSLARSTAQLAQAEYEVREAKRSLEYALRNLAAAMGDSEPSVVVDGDLSAAAPDEPGELAELVKETPDYHIAKIQVESAQDGVVVARSALFPSVGLSASARLGSGDWEDYSGSWSLGLNASVPLFSGGKNRSNVAAAKEQVIQSEMDLLDTNNSLLASLQEQWNSYVNAVESEAIQKELYDAELLRGEISAAKYKQGLLDYEDWDSIEDTLISQGKSYLQARRSSEMQQAYWKNALGLSIWNMDEGK